MKQSQRLTCSVSNSWKYQEQERPWLTNKVDLVLPSTNCSAVTLLGKLVQKQSEMSLFQL